MVKSTSEEVTNRFGKFSAHARGPMLLMHICGGHHDTQDRQTRPSQQHSSIHLLSPKTAPITKTSQKELFNTYARAKMTKVVVYSVIHAGIAMLGFCALLQLLGRQRTAPLDLFL
ncbi:MAG: hypothetical protein AOA66_0943 [Candidatus Bathyarchaeota archaeon BA2]|nr:MAG: hypothetical protein AOA66_0943 [Candidatus Bathyarchaeota archaeon BA2]